MEAARLGLSEYGAPVPRLSGLGLPVDPWLAPPLLTALPGEKINVIIIKIILCKRNVVFRLLRLFISNELV